MTLFISGIVLGACAGIFLIVFFIREKREIDRLEEEEIRRHIAHWLKTSQ